MTSSFPPNNVVNRLGPSSFSYRSIEQRDARRRLLWVTALVALIYAVDLISGGLLRGYVRSATAAAWNAGTRIERGIMLSGLFASNRSLSAQNEALRIQLAEHEGQSAAAAAALAENELLRQMAGVVAKTPGLTVPVVSSFTSSPYGTFFVGAGEADGVVEGSLVLAPDGYVIGRVTDVGAHTSLVVQLFASRKELEVVISGVPLTLVGEGGGNAIARAPRGTLIAEGDVAFAPSLSDRPVAVVGAVAFDPADAYTLVSVRTSANIASLRYVRIIEAH